MRWVVFILIGIMAGLIITGIITGCSLKKVVEKRLAKESVTKEISTPSTSYTPSTTLPPPPKPQGEPDVLLNAISIVISPDKESYSVEDKPKLR